MSGSKSGSSGYIGFVVLVVPVNPEIPLVLVFLVIQVVLASGSSCYMYSGSGCSDGSSSPVCFKISES